MSQHVFRYVVPIDDSAHTVRLASRAKISSQIAVRTGPCTSVNDYAIEFWAEHDDLEVSIPRLFSVVGTGHPMPSGAKLVATAPRMDNGLVFHLIELLS